ncbi:hypothetical protein D3C73_832040 [compost metagenome]
MYHLKTAAIAGAMALFLALGWAPASNASAHSQLDQFDPQHHRCHHFRGGHIIKDTADLTGIDPKTIVEEMKQGKTLQQIVQTKKGWTEDEYVKKLTETLSRNIDKALNEGNIDATKAKQLKAELPDKLKKIVNRTWKSTPQGHPATEYQNNKINWSQTK